MHNLYTLPKSKHKKLAQKVKNFKHAMTYLNASADAVYDECARLLDLKSISRRKRV